jgi:hypothetical protein
MIFIYIRMICLLRQCLTDHRVVRDPYFILANGSPAYWGKIISLIDGLNKRSMHCTGARLILIEELSRALQKCHSEHCPECADTHLRKLLNTCDACDIQCFANCSICTCDEDKKLALMRCTALSCSFCHTKRAKESITFSEIVKSAKDM